MLLRTKSSTNAYTLRAVHVTTMQLSQLKNITYFKIIIIAEASSGSHWIGMYCNEASQVRTPSTIEANTRSFINHKMNNNRLHNVHLVAITLSLDRHLDLDLLTDSLLYRRT